MLDDLRKTIEATIGELTPARARSLAKNLAGPGAAKDQVARSATELIEWSQKNRDRLKEFVRREVSSQVGTIGVAAQSDLEALKKRVRTLERALERQSGAARTESRSTKSKAASAKPTRTPSKKKATAKATGASSARG